MKYRPLHCNRPMAPLDRLYGWVDTHEGVEVDDQDGNHIEYDPQGWTEVLWDTQITVGYGCRECGHVTYLEKFEDLGKDYTVNDLVSLLLREAAMLLSEHGENLEYDRAISELVCTMSGRPMEERQEVEAHLRTLNQKMRETTP